MYSGTADVNGLTGAVQLTSPIGSPAFGEAVMTLKNGVTIPFDQYKWPNFDPGQFPKINSLNAPPTAIDQNGGRPARQVQWSVGWNAPGLINVNAITPQRLAAFGLDENNAVDRTLLASRLDSAAAAQRGFNKAPYAGFPLSSTVAQSLRPFPQFGTLNYMWSPLGKTWYDSLQMKATKRFSHGLTFTSVFSWQKQLYLGSPVNDVFNRAQNKYLSANDQPFAFNTSVTYTTPKVNTNWGAGGKALSWAARDWTLGAFLAYASGLPILAPASNNSGRVAVPEHIRRPGARATPVYAGP